MIVPPSRATELAAERPGLAGGGRFWSRWISYPLAYHDYFDNIGCVIYATPPLRDIDESVLGIIGALRDDLRFFLHEPRRWTGSLRRAAFARAARGSLSIEGYHTSVESAAAIIDGEEPADVRTETQRAITGYREAMTCVLQIAPGAPDINVSLLLSLHFMMMQYDFSQASRPLATRRRVGAQ